MHRLASDVRSAPAVRPIAAKVADAVAAHLGARELPHIRNAACRVLLALAELDADALWLLLFRLSAQVVKFPLVAKTWLLPGPSFAAVTVACMACLFTHLQAEVMHWEYLHHQGRQQQGQYACGSHQYAFLWR